MTERNEDWARELWPDDDEWPEFDPDGARQPYLGTSPQHGSKQRSRRLLGLMTTAVVAVAAGVGGALAVKQLAAGSSPSPPAQSSSRQPHGRQPAGGTTGAIVVGGQVTAVSARSITISAGPESVTARVTGSTRFSGKVSDIAGVRVGDTVLARIAERNGISSLVALQDPVSVS